MKISIVTPVYNAGEYLAAAMDSIRANACDGVELELLLIDDCSTDPLTLQMLDAYEREAGVRVLRQESNGGPSRARNVGIRAATGDWIGFLDADDLFAPGSIALRRDTIAKFPDATWLASDILEMRTVDTLTHFNSFHVSEKNGLRVGPGVYKIPEPTREMVGWQSLPPMGAMLLRRDLLDKVGLFGEDLLYGEDIYFCLLASTYADLYWLEQPCLYLRRHHESMTKNLLRMACESPKYTGRLMVEPRLRSVRKQLRWQHAASLRHMSKVSLMHNYRGRAFIAALRSIIWTPNSTKGFLLAWQALSPKRPA